MSLRRTCLLLAALPLFFFLIKRCLGPRPANLALALFVLSRQHIYYSAEFKQYSTDVAVALAILLATVAWWQSRSGSRFVALLLIGALGVFFSHAAVFVLAGAASAMLPQKRWISSPASAPGAAAGTTPWSGVTLRTGLAGAADSVEAGSEQARSIAAAAAAIFR